MGDQNEYSATVTQLIRRPASDVFSAFADGQTITTFWLSSTTGPLSAGATVHWEFLVDGAAVDTEVTDLVQNERIAITWSDGTTVAWQFEEDDDGTVVSITFGGLRGDPADVVAEAASTAEGFTTVLLDLKTLLEGGSSTNLSRDKARLIERQRD